MLTRFLSLIFFCGLISSALAQPVLTSATNSPVVGDTIYVYGTDVVTGLTAGSSGAAATWDFSTLSATVSDTLKYTAAAATPYTDSFPGCGLAVRFFVSGYGYSGYDYYASDTNKFTYNGFFKPGSGTGYFTWSRSFTKCYYPLSYTSSYLDSSVNNASGLKVVSSFSCDGYGTLKMPDGVHSNVLRVHKINTIYYSPSFIQRNENYLWYESGLHHELLQVNYDTTGGTRHLASAYYSARTPIPALCKDVKSIRPSVYPNPATNTLHLEVGNQEPCRYSILDCFGRTVVQESVASGAGSIDVSTFPAGIYYIRFTGTSDAFVTKFVKM